MRIDLSPKVNAKSLLAAGFAGLTAYGYARSGGVTGDEAWGIVLAVLAPLGIVWVVPNADPKARTGEHAADAQER